MSYVLSLALILTDSSVLKNITVGRLRIVTNTRTYEFPEHGADAGEEEEFHAELRVINDTFWVRLCTMGDLGFAEAYMFGDVVCDDLISTFLVSTLCMASFLHNGEFYIATRCFSKTTGTSRRSTRHSRGSFPSLSDSRLSASSTRSETLVLTFRHTMTFLMTCLKVCRPSGSHGPVISS